MGAQYLFLDSSHTPFLMVMCFIWRHTSRLATESAMWTNGFIDPHTSDMRICLLRICVVAWSRSEACNKCMDGEMAGTIALIVEKNRGYTIHQINMGLWNRLPNKPHVCDNVIVSCWDGHLISLEKICDLPAPGAKAARTAMAHWLLGNAQTVKFTLMKAVFVCGWREAWEDLPDVSLLSDWSTRDSQMSTIFTVLG